MKKITVLAVWCAGLKILSGFPLKGISGHSGSIPDSVTALKSASQ